MANQIEIRTMMKPGEAARMLHVHINTLRRWSDQGIIQTYRIGSRRDRRYIREDITHFSYGLHKNGGDAKKVKLS